MSLVQEFVEIEAWLLLAFSFCLHNQISSINFIDTSQEKGYSSNRQNKEWLLLSAGFMTKFELVLVLTQEKAFILKSTEKA